MVRTWTSWSRRAGAFTTSGVHWWNEIRQYREQHRVHDWRALDDSAFEFPLDCAELILCNGATGLAQREVQMIKTWLGFD